MKRLLIFTLLSVAVVASKSQEATRITGELTLDLSGLIPLQYNPDQFLFYRGADTLQFLEVWAFYPKKNVDDNDKVPTVIGLDTFLFHELASAELISKTHEPWYCWGHEYWRKSYRIHDSIDSSDDRYVTTLITHSTGGYYLFYHMVKEKQNMPLLDTILQFAHYEGSLLAKTIHSWQCSWCWWIPFFCLISFLAGFNHKGRLNWFHSLKVSVWVMIIAGLLMLFFLWGEWQAWLGMVLVSWVLAYLCCLLGLYVGMGINQLINQIEDLFERK